VAKKKTSTSFVVQSDGEDLRSFANQEEAESYVAARETAGGDLPSFQVIEVEKPA